MTMLLCVACVGGLIAGSQLGWPWWAMVLLAIGAVIFFFAGPLDD